MAILAKVAEGRTNEFVFPGQKENRPLSGMALEMVLRRMRIDDATVHGFRSTFRDWAGNETSFPREVAEQARREAGAGMFDLVVSDVVMPIMDGPAMARAIRGVLPDLPVLFMSGYAEDTFRRGGEKAEELHFLPKPFGLKQLVAKVKDVLSGAPPAPPANAVNEAGT